RRPRAAAPRAPGTGGASPSPPPPRSGSPTRPGTQRPIHQSGSAFSIRVNASLSGRALPVQLAGDDVERSEDRHHVGEHRAFDQLRERRIVDEGRSEEHTSELQSRENIVCRLLLETKKKSLIRPSA